MERNALGAKPRPMVGIGVYLLDASGRVLLGERKGSHGTGEWAPPGGHLEFGETFVEAAQKEVEEETGLAVSDVEFFAVDNNLRYAQSDGKHYVTLSFRAKHRGGTPEVREPEKCARWEWFALDALPSPLAEFAEHALERITAPGIATE